MPPFRHGLTNGCHGHGCSDAGESNSWRVAPNPDKHQVWWFAFDVAEVPWLDGGPYSPPYGQRRQRLRCFQTLRQEVALLRPSHKALSAGTEEGSLRIPPSHPLHRFDMQTASHHPGSCYRNFGPNVQDIRPAMEAASPSLDCLAGATVDACFSGLAGTTTVGRNPAWFVLASMDAPTLSKPGSSVVLLKPGFSLPPQKIWAGVRCAG